MNKADQRLALLNSQDRCAEGYVKTTIGAHVDIVPIPANHKKASVSYPATAQLPEGKWLITTFGNVEEIQPPAITNGELITPVFDQDSLAVRLVVNIDHGGGAITFECRANRTRGYVAYTYEPVDVTKTSAGPPD